MTTRFPTITPDCLPRFLAGPILRRCTQDRVVLWAVVSQPLTGHFELSHLNTNEAFYSTSFSAVEHIQVGEHAYIVCANFTPTSDMVTFPCDQPLEYDIVEKGESVLTSLSHLLYPNESKPQFVITHNARSIIHGSCRHPHHSSKDALATLDIQYETTPIEQRTNMLFMSGDQIYADDVAGPMLWAIRQVITALKLYDQPLDEAPFSHDSDLGECTQQLYQRKSILPKSDINHSLYSSWRQKPPSPVFTSLTQDNHLISFNEYFAMYLLVWSPALWESIDIPKTLPTDTDKQLIWGEKWKSERVQIQAFVLQIPHVARLLAHIPTYMIFDDHDITDDWNLTLNWEKAIYGTPMSNQMIGNGLLAYLLCQGWGNNPDTFNLSLLNTIRDTVQQRTLSQWQNLAHTLMDFHEWHYSIPTYPKVMVLDTRTQRWRSENSDNLPSGLMDWEGLMHFQQEVMHEKSVIVVSAGPMFGVKFIESLQKIASTLRRPTDTDSENWMAHHGTANALLNIFKHRRTPDHFVILSGDVHYSFAYDVSIRFRKGGPKIWQITCSGFKNQFPVKLLNTLEWCDRMLFSSSSWLNFLTQRKRMKITKRHPSNDHQRYLVNASAVGELVLNKDGSPACISVITSEGETITFER
ncbi:alkaline phosphatase family protein [Vibrio sp.]|nr:alkaline phosphatase family protein [Vibrio sp.]